MTSDLAKLMEKISLLQSEPTPEPVIEIEKPTVHPLVQAMQELREEGIVESPAVIAYHGTMADITKFRPFTHFGTEKAARDRIEHTEVTSGKIYKVQLDLKNPLTVRDVAGNHYDRFFIIGLREKNLISPQEMLSLTRIKDPKVRTQALLDKLNELGIDGFVYRNKYEDIGNTSYIITDPKQVKVLSVEPAEEGILESINLNEGPDGDHQTGGSLGLPFPGTYEQEYGNFKSKGQRRMTTLTTEALDSSYDYRGSKQNPGNDFYFDTEDGQEYKVEIDNVDNDITVAFSARGQGDEHKTGITGTGNSRKIFGTVIKIVKDYIRKSNPEIIAFSADNSEPSRVRLYKMLASQANKELPNYKFTDAFSNGGLTTYYLTRDGAKIPTSTKVKAKAGKALDAVFEENTTLTQLYGDDKPDRNETIWDYGTMIWDIPYEIDIISPRTLDMYLCEQYNVEFIEDLFERMSEEQHEIVDNYIKDPNLSNKIIVLDNGYIVDGNHRAIAAALTKRPIKYIDIGEEEES